MTVYKMTVGVSIENWDHVVLMSGSASGSPNDYVQTLFRAGTPKEGKQAFKVVDFAAGRSAAMMSFLASVRMGVASEDTDFKREFTRLADKMQTTLVRADRYGQFQRKRLDYEYLLEHMSYLPKKIRMSMLASM
jgi:hypothetical protein